MISYKYLILIISLIIFFGCDSHLNHQIINSDDGNIDSINILENSILTQTIRFSESGNIGSRIFYDNNRKIGIWTSSELFNDENIILNYYPNGILKSKGYQDSDGQLHGHWSYYNRNGELESDRYYFRGSPDGDWYSYSHGNKKIVSHDYIKGNGVWEEFYSKKNKITDKESTFYRDTIITIERASYQKNKLVGPYMSRHKNGEIKSIGNYAEGKKDGEWKYYNNLGNIVKVENYSMGLLHGDLKHYFDDGQNIKIIGQYQNNRKAGDWFWYFDVDKKSSYRKHYSS